MPRTLHAFTLARIQETVGGVDLPETNIRYAHLVSINLGGGTIERYTSAPNTMSWNSNYYYPSELLLDVGGVSQSATLQNNQLGISISTAEGNYASWMQSKNWFNGDVYYYLAPLSVSSGLLGVTNADPILVFKGLLSVWNLVEGQTPSIELTADSHWADFERINGRRTNNHSQQQFYSSDQGMEYAADSIRDMRWGQS